MHKIHLFVCCICLVFATGLSQDEVMGLMQPVVVEQDTTLVLTKDYFVHPENILNIYSDSSLQCKLNATKDSLWLIRTKEKLPVLSTIKIQTRLGYYDILIKRSRKEKITFTFNAESKPYSKVSVVGDLTNWNPNVLFMEKRDSIWSISLSLNPGRYQYQIVADGNWFLDPGNSDSIDNGIGGYNSQLLVGKQIDRQTITLTRTSNASFNGNDYQAIQFTITSTLDPEPGHFIAFWNNQRISIDETWILDMETFIEQLSMLLTIPVEAVNFERSHIRIYGSAKNVELNDLLIPLEYGKVIIDPQQLKRTDFQSDIMYFLMVDRFVNGDPSNDKPVTDDRVADVANYMGGDFAGMQKKIHDGYFQDLGINTLWVSPVFQNPMGAYQEFPAPHRWFSGYHGYWPISLSKVDVRFGSQQEFASLVGNLHAQNMNIYLDYVANHIHAEHPLWSQHPEWFSALDLPDGRKNLRLWDEQRLTTWFEPYMPSFDHAQKVVAEACADSAMFWLKTYQIDGFRHDATKHIETEFWRLLTYKIKTEVSMPQNKPIYQIGETFGSRALIGSYMGSGLLDAQFDFNLYFDARAVFATADIPFSRLSSSLNETFAYYGWHHVMGNLTGNHDMARFISYASGDLKWDENDKEAGWHRNITVTDTTGYRRLKMLHAFNLTIPGIPIIYYGDEIGMPGANDPDNRRMMRFDSLSQNEANVLETVKKLTKLRSGHMALMYGSFRELTPNKPNPMHYAYLRSYFDDHVLVVFNKSDKPMQMELKIGYMYHYGTPVAQFGSTVQVINGTLHIENATGNSFEIITFEPR